MIRTITPAAVRRLWRDRAEVALFDVREEGPFAEAHPFFAVSLPLSRIELTLHELVPRRGAPIVLYDDGEGLAERAAGRIEQLGYADVSVMSGGLAAYAEAGELFRDVNVPGKAFGELVESICHTPSLPATEVKRLIDDQADIAVLDARRFEEYRTMNIPTGVSVPGGELALRALDMVPSTDTLVIVNCAGRTRSIIGAQTLRNAGVPHRVVALRNGTIGWTLAGQALETGQSRRFVEPSSHGRAVARAAAARWAKQVGVRVIDRATLVRWSSSEQRSLYQLDVRTPEEYRAGHPPGFVSAPGGQLVQAVDEWVAVRGARIVLFDDDGVRARMTGTWLVQMGWEVAVLEEGALAASEAGTPAPRRPALPEIEAQRLTPEALSMQASATVVDLAPSPVYSRGHIPGASFVLRSRFDEDLPTLPGHGPIVLTSPDGDLATFAAHDASMATTRPVRVLTGGTAAWAAAGLPLDQTPVWVSPAHDVYKRPYEGTDNAVEAMHAYIAWELQLIAQVANDGISNFHVVRPGIA